MVDTLAVRNSRKSPTEEDKREKHGLNAMHALRYRIFQHDGLEHSDDGGCWECMGRKRDLKNVHAKRPPSYNPEDPEDLNEWGEELEQMTSRRRLHNERHRPGKADT